MSSSSIDPESSQPQQPQTDEPPRPKPKHDFPKSQIGKLWDAFGNPDEPINALPGVTSTGRLPTNATIADGIRTLSAKDFETFGQKPCVRDSLMSGMAAGFGIGGIRAVVGGLSALWPACNWAVASFAVVSFGFHEYCQHMRRTETQGMAEAVVLMRELKEKRRLEVEEAKKQKAELARIEQEKLKKSWTHLPNYKFW